MTRLMRLTLIALLALLPIPACKLKAIKVQDRGGETYARLGQELDYFDYLRDKRRASMSDGARLVLLLLGENPWYKSNSDLKAMLSKHEAVKAEWEISEAAPLTRGRLSYMVVFSTGIKTSVVLQLTTPTERYALREMVFHELINSSSPLRYVTGAELLDVMADTDNFLKSRGWH